MRFLELKNFVPLGTIFLMSKRLFTILGITFSVLAVTGVFFVVRERNAKQEVALDNQAVSEQKDVASPQGKDEPSKESDNKTEFVTDVDPDVNHWQTKETEFFTIKFPKEWYWMESAHSESEGYSRVITNNPNFPINKYAEIGLSMGADYTVANDTEVVIPFGASATSDVGTPQQSIDSSLWMAKKQDASAACGYLSSMSIPVVARCLFMDKNDQKAQLYFIANKMSKIVFQVRTTKSNTLQKDILDTMAKSMVVKDSL